MLTDKNTDGQRRYLPVSIFMYLCWRGYRGRIQAICTMKKLRTRAWETKPGRLYPLVFAGEGIGYKTRSIIPAGLRGRGYRIQNQANYTHWLSDQRGATKDFARISHGDLGPAGHNKRFCQNKPRGSRISGAHQKILPE